MICEPDTTREREGKRGECGGSGGKRGECGGTEGKGIMYVAIISEVDTEEGA